MIGASYLHPFSSELDLSVFNNYDSELDQSNTARIHARQQSRGDL